MKKYWPLFLITITAGFLFLYRLGRDLLWDWDECLYGQYVKEMPRVGHWLTNVWNGYIDLQKPPLYSWLLQIPSLFGRNEFTLRILSVLGGLGILIAVYLFAQKYFSKRVAILSSLILLCSELFVIYSLKMSTDILYTLFIFLGVWTWIESGKQKLKISIRQPANKFQIFSGVLFGAAVMVKGLGATQFLAALFVALFLNFKKERLIDFVKMSLVFLVVIIPWHAATYLQYGDRFIKVYIFDNIIKRSKYPIEFHRERIWFYFVLLYRELFPWILAAIVFPIAAVLSLSKDLRRFLKNNELILTILLLILIPLVSISRVQTRIAWYALPLYPFIAIYLAYCLNLLIDFVSKKKNVLRSTLYTLLVTLLILDALRLISNETKFTKSTREVPPRYEVMLEAKKQAQKELNYLVAYGERQAPLILPPEEEIDMTFVYGGNPCAVYYSNKKVNYFYETDRFEQTLKIKKGLFLIENGDAKYAEGRNILFKNAEYTLFEL